MKTKKQTPENCAGVYPEHAPLFRKSFVVRDEKIISERNPNLFVWAAVNRLTGEVEMADVRPEDDDELGCLSVNWVWKRFSLTLDDPETPYAVFAVAYIPNTQLICATTRPDGKVGLPGGKIDPGETSMDAVIRESNEEGWNLKTYGFVIRDTYFEGRRVLWMACELKTTPIVENHKEADRGIHPIAVSPNMLSPGLGNEFLFSKNPRKP